MKFVCDQSLSAHLATIGKAVPSRPSHPILASVLVTADADRISLTGFDLSTGIQSTFPADVEIEGSTTIPYKLLSDIVSRLDGELTVSIDESQVTIKSKTGSFSIHCQEAKEYPELPEVKAEPINIPIAILRDGLSKTLFATSTEESKQVLCGVRLTIESSSIEFASTDGHRLAVSMHEADTFTDDQSISLTIPSKALQALQRMIDSTKQEMIAFQFDEAQLVAELDGQRLTSRLLEGQYPNYRQLIPKQFSKSVTIDRKPLIASLERVSILADQKNGIVKMMFDNADQKLILSADCADVGSGRETIDAQVSDDLEIAFSAKYLLEGLKAIDSSTVLISANTATTPAVFQPVGGGKMIYLVMPVQIRA